MMKFEYPTIKVNEFSCENIITTSIPLDTLTNEAEARKMIIHVENVTTRVYSILQFEN